MNPITTLSLATPRGAFEFSGAEVPEQINFGGAQMLCTHKMIGGLRVIDALGPDDAPLSWNGMFLGVTAAQRARFLDYIRRSGLTCTLTWGVFQYSVIVSEFKADFKKPYWIPFSITCEVIRDQTQDVTDPSSTTPADAITGDAATMTQLAGSINDPTLSTLAAGVASALSAVTNAAQPLAGGLVSLTAAPVQVGEVSQISTISSSASSAITAAAAPLAALQAGVQSQITAAQAALAAIPVLGQITPTQPVAGQAVGLIAQCNAATQLPSLYELASVATRMQENVALIANPVANNQQVTGGGNLYQLASQTYGDATRWTDIAQASGIADPMTVGFNTITVPQ
jgi:hypothetical protein